MSGHISPLFCIKTFIARRIIIQDQDLKCSFNVHRGAQGSELTSDLQQEM